MREAVLAIVFVFTLGFAALTIQAAADGGFTVLTALSLLVLALFGVAILGALRGPRD